MKSDWKTVELKDIIQFKNGKKRPTEEGSIPVYGGNGVLSYTSEGNNKNCVIVGRVGAYCGSVYYEKNECWVSDNAIAAIPKSGTDLLYAYYLLKHLKLNNLQIGSSQPLLTQGILNKISFMIPPFEEQRKISKILWEFDCLIKTNESVCENLFEQAVALYREYFIDFGPYNGIMPEEWHIGTVDEIIELHDSKRIPLSAKERESREKIYPYYGATSCMDYVDDYIFDGIYLLLGEDGTVVNDLGYPILQYVYGKFWVNNHAHILTGKNGFSVEELYLMFSLTNIKNIVTGAVQLKISQQNLKKIQVIIPAARDLKQFDAIIQPLFKQIRNVRTANEKLKETSNALIGKLMRGELDVENIKV